MKCSEKQKKCTLETELQEYNIYQKYIVACTWMKAMQFDYLQIINFDCVYSP